jgi:hypothetical protein
MRQAPPRKNWTTPWGTYTPDQVDATREDLQRQYLPSEGEALALALALRFPKEDQLARDKLVARLKQEEDEEQKKERPKYWEGKQAGKEWVFKHASLKQLKRLRQAVGTEPDNIKNTVVDWNKLSVSEPIAMGFFWAVSGIKRPEKPVSNIDPAAMVAFWRANAPPTGFSFHDVEYATGYVTGILELWGEVEPLIYNP